MIHNAGVASRGFVVETDMDVYKRVMATNFFGPVALTKALLPSMQSAGYGHFIVISSLSGKYGVPKLSAYSASKHALHGFFESLRAEVHPFGIKVSIIIPGFINTAIIKNALNEKGEAVGKNMAVNEKGMSAEQCAHHIIKKIKAQKEEAVVGGSEVWTVHLKRFFPGLFSLFIRSHPVKKLQAIFRPFKK
jgi:short-subunit dehydrogenase